MAITSCITQLQAVHLFLRPGMGWDACGVRLGIRDNPTSKLWLALKPNQVDDMWRWFLVLTTAIRWVPRKRKRKHKNSLEQALKQALNQPRAEQQSKASPKTTLTLKQNGVSTG